MAGNERQQGTRKIDISNRDSDIMAYAWSTFSQMRRLELIKENGDIFPNNDLYVLRGRASIVLVALSNLGGPEFTNYKISFADNLPPFNFEEIDLDKLPELSEELEKSIDYYSSLSPEQRELSGIRDDEISFLIGQKNAVEKILEYAA